MIYNRKCELCPLHENSKTVCMEGAGADSPKVLLVGDFPSGMESAEDAPFTDQRGKLIRKSLEEAGIPLDDTVVTYALKCTPVGKAKAVEISTCATTYLVAEVEMFKPDLVVCLGKNSQVAVLKDRSSLYKTMGNFRQVEIGSHKCWAVVTDNPYTIIKAPSKKKTFLGIFQRIHSFLYKGEIPFFTVEKLERFDFQVLEDLDKLERVISVLEEKAKDKTVYISYDTETTGLDPELFKEDFRVLSLQFGESFIDDDEKNDSAPVYFLPIASDSWEALTEEENTRMITLLRRFFTAPGIEFIAHNAKYDVKVLMTLGIPLYNHWDTLLMYALVHGESSASLKVTSYQVSDLGGYESMMKEAFEEKGDYDVDPEILVPYGSLDIVVTRKLFSYVYKQLMVK